MITREQRMSFIVDYVANNPYATTAEIARGVGLRKTPYLRALLAELVGAGLLAWTPHTFPGGAEGRLYVHAGTVREGR